MFMNRIDSLSGDIVLHPIQEFSPDIGHFPDNFESEFMVNNSIGPRGYGSTVATSSIDFYVTVLFRNGTKKSLIAGSNFTFPNWKSGGRMPPLEVVMVDAFFQRPALTRSDCSSAAAESVPLTVYEHFIKATVDANEKHDEKQLISNPVVTDVSSGKVNITLGGPLAKSGNYSFDLWTEDDRERAITFRLEVRECFVNEESVLDEKLCNECDAKSYNFDPKHENCTRCPDNANCDYWGMSPKKAYWTVSPCSTIVSPCLSIHSCDYGISFLFMFVFMS